MRRLRRSPTVLATRLKPQGHLFKGVGGEGDGPTLLSLLEPVPRKSLSIHPR